METNVNSIVEVCGKIYDIVEENMIADGGVMRLSRENFLGSMETVDDELDLKPVRNAKNFRFFNYVFHHVFGTAPTEPLLEYWTNDIRKMPREDFQRRFLGVLQKILASNGRCLIVKN